MSNTIKVSVSAAVVITDFHKAVFTSARLGHNAAQTMATKLQALVTSKYGTTAPTFEQYRGDRAALRELAKAKGLADDQWVRKPYCAAVKAVFGELPVSMDAAAVQKRAQREAAEASAKVTKPAATATAGAPAGETQEHPVSEAEQIEQLVTRIGLLKMFDAGVRILKADDKTKAQAVHLEKMLSKVAALMAAQTVSA